ncbi:MAG TPA: glycosyltransferase family 39 protein [Polyangiaceae bacterium]|nr:glycosyltransferase family 39 protein [Polyangiaceae bacterium]
MSDRPRSSDLGIALLLWVAYAGVLGVTVPAVGYSASEVGYLQSTEAVGDWLGLLIAAPEQALHREMIEKAWASSETCFSAFKLLAAASRQLLSNVPWASPGFAYRLPPMVWGAFGVALIHGWASRVLNRAAGLVAALTFALIPVAFSQAHVAGSPLSIAVTGLLCCYCYVRSLERSGLGWVLATWGAFVLLLQVQPTGWLLVVAFVAHFLLLQGRTFWNQLRRRRLLVPRAWLYVAVFSWPGLLASWPRLWFEPWQRLQSYLDSGVGAAPGNPWVITAGTVPGISLVLFLTGTVGSLLTLLHTWEHSEAPESSSSILSSASSSELLWLFAAIASYAMVELNPRGAGSGPDAGGVNVWIGAYPYFALLAARGFDGVCRSFAENSSAEVVPPLIQRLGRLAVGVSVLAGPLVMCVHSYPFGQAFYTPVVGGAPGAANLGLHRTGSSESLALLSTYFNEHASAGQTIYLPRDIAAFERLREDGRVREDLQPTSAIGGSEYAPYTWAPKTSAAEYRIWFDYGTTTPAEVVAHDGVPIVWVYERR